MSKKRDSTEVMTNMVSGGIINYFLTILLFPTSKTYAIGTTIIFFCVSYARSYFVRRAFRKHEESMFNYRIIFKEDKFYIQKKGFFSWKTSSNIYNEPIAFDKYLEAVQELKKHEPELSDKLFDSEIRALQGAINSHPYCQDIDTTITQDLHVLASYKSSDRTSSVFDIPKGEMHLCLEYAEDLAHEIVESLMKNKASSYTDAVDSAKADFLRVEDLRAEALKAMYKEIPAIEEALEHNVFACFLEREARLYNDELLIKLDDRRLYLIGRTTDLKLKEQHWFAYEKHGDTIETDTDLHYVVSVLFKSITNKVLQDGTKSSISREHNTENKEAIERGAGSKDSESSEGTCNDAEGLGRTSSDSNNVFGGGGGI